MNKIMKLNTLTLMSFFVLCTTFWGSKATLYAAGEKEVTEEKEESSLDMDKDKTEPNATAVAKADVLAKSFGVSESYVLSLKTDKKLGWGEISHLLAIAKASGQTPDTILALRTGGMGWGEIAKKYDLKLGAINKEIRTTFKEISKIDREKRALVKERTEHSSQRGEERIEKQRLDRDISRPSMEKIDRPSHEKIVNDVSRNNEKGRDVNRSGR